MKKSIRCIWYLDKKNYQKTIKNHKICQIFFESDHWPLFWFPSILIVKTDPVTEPNGLEVEFQADQSNMEFNIDGPKVEPRIVGGREANPRKFYFLLFNFLLNSCSTIGHSWRSWYPLHVLPICLHEKFFYHNNKQFYQPDSLKNGFGILRLKLFTNDPS